MARFCSRDNEPITNWNGVPIYLTTIITAAFVLGLVIAAIMPAAGLFMFVLPGTALTPITVLTYPFVAPFSIFTVLAVYIFYQLSLGLETHLGRSKLAVLVGLLALAPALVGVVACYGFGFPVVFAGIYFIAAGILIAFAALYPSAKAFGFVSFRSVACAYLAICSLVDSISRNWPQFFGFWAAVVTAFLYIYRYREQEYDDAEPVGARILGWFRRKPSFRVLPTPTPAKRTTPLRAASEDTDVEIDALLDKIAKSGLASLSNAERAKLERARQELIKKEKA